MDDHGDEGRDGDHADRDAFERCEVRGVDRSPQSQREEREEKPDPVLADTDPLPDFGLSHE